MRSFLLGVAAREFTEAIERMKVAPEIPALRAVA
jgi:hypothetical protein